VDGMLFLLQILGMQKHYRWCFFLLLMGMTAITEASVPDPAGKKAAGIVAGLQSGAGGKLIYNEKTDRLEVRDDLGGLVDEISLGTSGKAVDVAGQEYRLSFGKDEMARRSVLVRAGPAMQRPITLEILGRKAVLSPEASLLATLGPKEQVFYEPSICGEVYYIEGVGGVGNRVSRLATNKREVAVLAKPSNATGAGPGTLENQKEDGKEMERAGDAVKSALFSVLGLPDKQPTTKSKVYRLRGNSSGDTASAISPSVQGEAGRP
jgi:hypothetical protein